MKYLDDCFNNRLISADTVQPQIPMQQTNVQYAMPTASQYACPMCHCPYSEKVSYTFWGGFIGPWIYGQVRCLQCKQDYNGKNGKPITGSTIAQYFLVSLIPAAIILVLILPMMFM